MLRFSALILSLLILSACKFHVMVPRGGEVQSTGSGTCLELTNCVHDISDSTFSESFEAVPNIGYRFEKWNNGGEFYCEDLTNPVCVVDSTLLAGIYPDSSIAAYKDLYIMPIFRPYTVIIEHVGDNDPVSEGWPLSGSAGTPGPDLGAEPIDDGGTLAWNVFDRLTSVGSGYGYKYYPGSAVLDQAMTAGWVLSAELRVNNSPDTLDNSISVLMQLENKMTWTMDFGSQADGDPIVALVLDSGGTRQVHALEGVGSGYHRYDLVYDSSTGLATLYVDGAVAITDYAGYVEQSGEGIVFFGSASSQGTGQGNFSYVSFSSGAP